MAKSKDSIGNTLIVAVSVSLVCSVLVASAAVMLKPQQLKNEEEFRQRIIVDVAGFDLASADLQTLYDQREPRLVDLETGDYFDGMDAEAFDAAEAANSAELGLAVPPELDIASVRRRAIYGAVFLVKDGDTVEQIILPVHGAGLWSTMYGYLAVEPDGTTVRGLRFYEHAETPGLGDQMDKEDWRAQWDSKELYGDSSQPQVRVIKGLVPEGIDGEEHMIDGMSGATLTGNGISGLLQYWTGSHGFGPYLSNFRESS
mgnify:CR=1 FL=1